MDALPALSLACAWVGDAFLEDLISEVAESCVVEDLPAEFALLLEGLEPAEKVAASPMLHSLITLEAQATERCIAQTRSALASGALAVNRQKVSSDVLTCTNCAAQVTANRFAPHLERCMLGKGRASARAASHLLRET